MAEDKPQTAATPAATTAQPTATTKTAEGTTAAPAGTSVPLQTTGGKSAEIEHAEKAFANRASTEPPRNIAGQPVRDAEAERVRSTVSADAARSVAEAVKRVTDAAVAEISKAQPADQDLDFDVSGAPGGKFRISGINLGSSGTVMLNGVQLHTNEWGPQTIVGDLPAGATAGEVLVHLDEHTVRKGRLRL